MSRGIEGAGHGPQVPPSDEMVRQRAAIGETPDLTRLVSSESLNNDAGYGLLIRLHKKDTGSKLTDDYSVKHGKRTHEETRMSSKAFRIVAAVGDEIGAEALKQREATAHAHKKKRV